MKLFFTFMLILSIDSFSQQPNSSSALSKSDYLIKSKRQKTAAWIMLAGGVATTITGIAIYNKAYKKAYEDNPFITVFSFGTNVNPAGLYIITACNLSAKINL